MNNNQLKVLLIEDDPGDIDFIREMLSQIKSCPFELECTDRLSTGVKRLDMGGIDVLLLDLSLPDSWGLDTVVRVQEQAPNIPIVVLTGNDDDFLATRALQEGMQDYLVKGQISGNLLERSLRYAIERQRMLAQLRDMSLIDELTDLYNRRGFLTLAEQQFKIANRENRKMLLVFVDLDDLKLINDTLGHQAGDLALIDTANIFKKIFRESDIIARIGGDEFAIIAMENCEGDAGEDNTEILASRLQKNLKAYNEHENQGYKLSLSVGIAHYDPEHPCPVDELLTRADKLMYQQKKGRQRS